ncbi:hypothetical protein VFPBJ_01553 [Purpureocillium lilacinum]|uniref:Uncharacterized protein n=1 Tax=Purpureocillium lilacinum TaxID=33203 RepID=A0A179HDE1_PURLI|nr:hypothetical protein VFPBJ_01553 [Purpureocillium lilacinum]
MACDCGSKCNCSGPNNCTCGQACSCQNCEIVTRLSSGWGVARTINHPPDRPSRHLTFYEVVEYCTIAAIKATHLENNARKWDRTCRFSTLRRRWARAMYEVHSKRGCRIIDA